jgi:hypothetical protein
METKTFENVTMYRTGEFLGGIHKLDCKSIEVTFDVKYAQYNDAVQVKYMEKGKRTLRGFVLSGASRWLRVCPQAQAIEPDPSMIPSESSTPGMTCKVSRYTSCDPRYETDFEDKAEAAGVNWLVAIGAGDREGAHLERCLAMDRHPAGKVTPERGGFRIAQTHDPLTGEDL